MFKKNTLTVPVMGIELLENRILFDAALGATVDAVEVQHDQASFDQTNFDHAILSNELQITEAPNTIVIIDSRVENSALIEAEFPDAQVFTLSDHYSGVEQIHSILQQFQTSETKPQEIILFSHGKPGELLIGSTSLTIDTIIQNYSELLKDIRNLTADNAVLAIYGCDVASTAEGQVALNTLANLTGLDIAASTDLTGATALTGDWELEYTTNSKFVAPVLSAQFQLEYPTTLAAPGNVASANLTLWLKANAGVTESGGTVTNWTDQSAAGGNNSVSQGDNTKQPQRQLSTVNFNPSLRFDGTNDELTRINFQGTEIISNNNNTMFAVVNVFSPGVVAQWEHNDGFARTDRINIEYTAPNNPRFDFSDDVGGKISGPAVSSTYHIVSGVANIPNNSLYVDGLRSGTTGVAPAADNSLFGNLSIGSYPDALGSVNAGMNLSEVIIYNTTLSLADKQKVESYLAVKYGITLDPTDNEGGITEGDYITSTGVTAWDFTANSGYHNNVAGVAIDSGSDLNQLKSKSINSGSAVTIEATSSLDDGDYLMWGSNGASGEISTEMPANSGFSKRLATEWKVQEVQDFVNTTVTFDLTTLGLTGRSSSDFAMVVDTDDGDFSNAFSFVSPSAFDGSTVTFNLGFLNNGFYFTLFTEANTAPTINNLDGDSTTLNPFVSATTTLDQGTSATFTDTTSSNLQDGALTVQFTAGSDPTEDTLVINNQGVGLGQIGVAGANVTYEGTTIGTFVGGSGGTPLTVNFNTNATPTAVSALLQQIQYTNTDPGSPTLGTRTITFSATDGDGGTSNTATVTLNLANSAPALNNLDGDTQTINPAVTATTTLDQAIAATILDTDSPDFNNGSLVTQFTAGSDPAEDTLVINNQGVGLGQIGVAGANVTYEGTTIGTFVGGSGGTPLTVNFNTNATPTAVSALLQQIQYTNTDPGSPTLGTRTITFSATDGDGGTSNTATVTLNLANSAPALNNLDGDTQTINPAVTATTALDQAMAATIVDTDSPDFNNGSLVTQFTAGSDPAEDTLVINNQGVGLSQIGVAGANVTYEGTTIGTFAGGSGGTPLTVDFNTNATPTAVSALLQQIQYTNTDPGSPTLGTRTITFSATDGDGGTSNTATVTVDVNNPAPVVSNLDGDNQSITPNVSNTTFLDQGTAASVTDDAPNFSTGSLTATFTAGSDSTEDVLSINNQGTSPGQIGISGSNVTYGGTIIGTFTGGTNNSPLVITFNANATPVAVTALTQQLQYTNTDTTDPTAGTRSINVNVVDNQGATSNTSTVTITINNINPTINNFTEVINVNPGDPTTFPLDRGTPATIVDPTSTDFNSGTLTATFVSGLVPGEDDVTVNNQGNGPGEIGVSGSTVSYGGTQIGTFSGGTNGVPLQFNFNSSANPTSVSALLQQITYVNQSPDDPTTGTRIINVVATDGDGGTSNVAVIRIDINGATPNIPTHPTTSGVDGESSGEESEVKPHITPHPTSSPISTTLSPGLAPPSLLSSPLPESLKPATTVSIDGKVVYHPLPHHNYDAERIQHMVFGLTNYDRGDIPNAMTTKVLGEPEATILDLIFVEVEKVHDSWAGYIDHSVQINGQAVTGYGGCVMDAPSHANFSIDAQRGVFNLNLSSGESAKVHLEVYLANGETIEQNVVVDGTTGSVSSMGSGSVNCKPSQATNDMFNNENSFSNQLSRLVATHYEH